MGSIYDYQRKFSDEKTWELVSDALRDYIGAPTKVNRYGYLRTYVANAPKAVQRD